jgi:hypothetical protein
MIGGAVGGGLLSGVLGDTARGDGAFPADICELNGNYFLIALVWYCAGSQLTFPLKKAG